MYIDHDGVIHAPPDPKKAKPLNPESLAAHGLGVSGLHSIGQKLKRYGTAKARNRAMAAFLVRSGAEHPHYPYNRMADRMYRCGSHLVFRHFLATNYTKLHAGKFCGLHLLCPLCAIRRGAKLLQRYHQRATLIADQYEFHHVVLTVANGHDLVERSRHLKTSFKRLRDRGKKGYGVWASVVGAVWSMEFTYDDRTGWHPHLHIIAATEEGHGPIRWGSNPDGTDSQLKADWRAATGDSFITFSEPIGRDSQSLVEGLCEVLKYAVKFGDLPLDKNLEAYHALKGKRLLQSSGVFYGIDLPEDDDLVDDYDAREIGPYIDILCKFTSGGYQTQHSDVTYKKDTETLHSEPNHGNHDTSETEKCGAESQPQLGSHREPSFDCGRDWDDPGGPRLVRDRVVCPAADARDRHDRPYRRGGDTGDTAGNTARTVEPVTPS